MAHSGVAWMASLGLGAAVMYMLDPADGRRRRAMLRDQTGSALRRTGRTTSRRGREWRNRAAGAVASIRSSDRVADDAVVEARVRTALGRVCSHPGAIAVGCADGIVELNGPILAREYDDVLNTVERTPGVLAVIDRMSQHADAARVPGLQGTGAPSASRPSWPLWAMGATCSAGLLFYAAAHRSRDTHDTVVS